MGLNVGEASRHRGDASVYLLTLCDYSLNWNMGKTIDSVLSRFLDLKRDAPQQIALRPENKERWEYLTGDNETVTLIPITDLQNGYVAEVVITRRHRKQVPHKLLGYNPLRMQIDKDYARAAELVDSLAQALNIPKKIEEIEEEPAEEDKQ